MIKKQFCRKGHDVSITGRTKWGSCIPCKLESDKHFANSEKRKEYEKQWNEEHKELIRKVSKEHYESNKEEILARHKQYALEHHKDFAINTARWRRENPELNTLIKLEQDSLRGLRTVSWGQEGMKEFYLNKPKGMTGDHVIPLQGELVSGLHVRWNLQYLSLSENSSKRNKMTPEEATKHYEQILIEAGLK